MTRKRFGTLPITRRGFDDGETMIRSSHVQFAAALFVVAAVLSACVQTAGRVSDKDIITSADIYEGPEGTIKRFSESRLLDGSYDDVFRSILEALQNKGFYIDSVDSKAGFIRANRSLVRDLVEGVHRRLDVVQLDARQIAFHQDFHIRVDDTLDWYQDLRREALATNW